MNRDEKIYAIEYTFAAADVAVNVKVKNVTHNGYFYEFYDDEELRTKGKYRFVPGKKHAEFQNLVQAEVTPEHSIENNRKNAKALSIVLDVDDIKDIVPVEVLEHKD